MEALIIGIVTLLLQAIQTIYVVWPPKQQNPRGKNPLQIPAGSVLVSKTRLYFLGLTSLVLIGVSTYTLLHRGTKFDDKDYAHMEHITDRTFANEVVDLDGKSFRHCKFVNTKLRFEGKASYDLTDNQFIGGVILYTDNPAISGALKLYKGLGLANGPFYDNNMNPQPDPGK